VERPRILAVQERADCGLQVDETLEVMTSVPSATAVTSGSPALEDLAHMLPAILVGGLEILQLLSQVFNI